MECRRGRLEDSMTQREGPPGAEAYVGALQALVDAMEHLQLKARKILASHGIPQLEPEAWYPLTTVAVCYQDVLRQVGPSTMRAIGRAILKRGRIPPDIKS